MLRQVLILKDEKIIYNKTFGKALSLDDFNKIYKEFTSGIGIEFDTYDFIKYKIFFTEDEELGLIFSLVVDKDDEISQTKTQLNILLWKYCQTRFLFGTMFHHLG